MAGTDWTEVEVEQLLRLRADRVPYAEIAPMLGRSVMSCTLKARLPRVAGPRAGRQRCSRIWSAEETALLLRCRDELKMTFVKIAPMLGRPESSVGKKYLELKGLSLPLLSMQTWLQPGPKVSADLLADRTARLRLNHPDITSAFFGDPLPGRSALDQRSGA